jgi:hypothetical protein
MPDVSAVWGRPKVTRMLAKTRGLGPVLALTSAFFIAGTLVILTLPEARGRQLENGHFKQQERRFV